MLGVKQQGSEWQLWGELWMILADPCFDADTKCLSKLPHLLRLGFRNGVRPLVVGDIAFLPKHVEFSNHGRVDAEGQFKRLNHAVVMVAALSVVPSDGQSSGGKLEGCVIRNVELPIGNQIRRLAGLQISIGDGEEVGDLLPTCLVLLEPPEFEPVLQAHSRHQSEKSSGQTRHH